MVREAYRSVKTKIDRDAEEKGIGLSTKTVYRRLMDRLALGDQDHKPIQAALETLFEIYPPQVDPQTREALRQLLLRHPDMKLSIASNTNFIRGAVLSSVVLDKLAGWSYKIFSDEWEMAKPNPNFWNTVKNYSPFDPEEIVHIGDNSICDGGCVAAGIQYIPVSGPQDIPMVLERI